MIGERVDKYEIKALLGEGGMGSVYRAEHVLTKKRVAVKVLLPALTQQPQIVERFRNEALAMGALDHPNLIDIYDCGQLPDGRWFIVMEYVDGRTLERVIQAGPIAPELAIRILAMSGAGIAAAHRANVLHRDLKPANILITARGGNPYFAKVIDWGISKLEGPGHELTSTGMTLGTLAYMAPEQLLDSRRADERSDVFALGVILYRMLTGGWFPFQHTHQLDEYEHLSAAGLHERQRATSPVDPRTRLATVPPAVATALSTALHYDPARRPQSVQAFVLMVAQGFPGSGHEKSGIEVVDEYAKELLEVGNLRETVPAPKSRTATRARYQLDPKPIGVGGMAEVFRAVQVGVENFSRVVAVKRVLPDYSQLTQFANMFVQEAKLASLLDHPNIVSVLDFDRDEQGQLRIVMEYVEGRDLAKVAERGRLPFEITNYLSSEILSGLGYAHDLPTTDGPRGIIHRDISPHNVLLSWEGAVKVSDFGIAKARNSDVATISTMIKGKPQYMSPEQVKGQALDGRSDLFAVGIVMWELLVGRRLFDGTEDEAMRRIAYGGGVLPPSQVVSDVPHDLEAVAMRLLQPDRSQRYANAALALADLKRCTSGYARRDDLVTLLRERFPNEIAARKQRSTPGQVIAVGRSTVPDRPGHLETKKDLAPEPTPFAVAPPDRPLPHTTLGLSSGQRVPSSARRVALFGAIGLAAAALAAVSVMFVATVHRHGRTTGMTSDAATTATVVDGRVTDAVIVSPADLSTRPVERTQAIDAGTPDATKVHAIVHSPQRFDTTGKGSAAKAGSPRPLNPDAVEE